MNPACEHSPACELAWVHAINNMFGTTYRLCNLHKEHRRKKEFASRLHPKTVFLNKLVLFKETFPNLLSCFNLSLNPSSHSNGLRATTCSWSKGAMVEGCMQRWNKTHYTRGLGQGETYMGSSIPATCAQSWPICQKTNFFFTVCVLKGLQESGCKV